MGLVRILLCLMLLAGPDSARADGGAVVGRERVGDLLVTVFVAPVPPTVGPADVSVLVQQGEGGAPVLDAEVFLEIVGGTPTTGRIRAARGQATNRLLYAALVHFPSAGPWRLAVLVRRGADEVFLEAPLEAAQGLPPAARFWPWLLLPALVVGVFLLHQWLRDR